MLFQTKMTDMKETWQDRSLTSYIDVCDHVIVTEDSLRQNSHNININAILNILEYILA